MFTREELFKMKEFNMIFLFVGTLEKRHVFPTPRAGGARRPKRDFRGILYYSVPTEFPEHAEHRLSHICYEHPSQIRPCDFEIIHGSWSIFTFILPSVGK